MTSVINDTIYHRFKYVTKKIHDQRTGIEQDINKLKQINDQLSSKTDNLDDHFNHVLKLVVSIIETHYLESLLLYQDEFDRHSMSLWGVNERKKPNAH